jgi:hypothetical protein
MEGASIAAETWLRWDHDPPQGPVEGRRAQLHQHRHCERSEAIQTVTAEGLWIASLRSQ